MADGDHLPFPAARAKLVVPLRANTVLLEDSDDLRVTCIEELIESSPPLGLFQANFAWGNFDLLVFLGFLRRWPFLYCFPLFGRWTS